MQRSTCEVVTLNDPPASLGERSARDSPCAQRCLGPSYRSFKRSFSPERCVGSCITVKKLESAGPQVHHDERIKLPVDETDVSYGVRILVLRESSGEARDAHSGCIVLSVRG